MEKSDILSRIRARYPAQLYLAFVGGKSLRIHYGDSLDEARIARLKGSICQIPLDLREEGEKADLEVFLSLEDCPGEPEETLCLRCGEQCFFLPGEEAEQTAMWTLYALAKELPCLKKLKREKLRAILYSADQQALAARLLNSADYWQNTLAAELLPPILEKAVLGNLQMLLSHAPRFSQRPLCASGWELLRRSGGLFAPSRRTTARALARELFGEQPFEEDLQAWRRVMTGHPAFQETLGRAELRVSEELFRRPMMEASVRLRDAVQELGGRLDPREDLRKANDALDASLEYKRLTPEQFGRIFEEAEKNYAAAARKMLALALLEPLAARLKKRVEETQPAAMKTFQDWNRSLRSFCRVSGGERLSIGWDRCMDLKDEELLVAQNGWTDPMLRSLYTGSGVIDGYYVLTWGCSTSTYERSKQSNGQMAAEMTPLPGMTEHLVLALMHRTILEG